MEEALRAHLADSGGLAALVGDRIQWAARDEPPSVVLHLIDAPPDYTLAGPSGLVQARVQIDCWGETFLKAKQIGVAVVSALPPRRHVAGGVRFLSCIVLDLDRGRFGESPNQFHRTRIDVRVSFNQA